jgi:antitoxin (DNA-binding transcriptional repressor) of toxin-antitoxin stability system
MKDVSIREMRSNLGNLDNLLAAENELIITHNKKAIARVLPVHNVKPRPSHVDLRALQTATAISSASLIHRDRGER